MALKKEKKQEIIKDLREKVEQQKSIIFVAIENLKAKELFDLRKKLKEAGCLIAVVKKTLTSIIFKEKKIGIDPKKLPGQTALIFGFDDEISPAKIAYKFSLTNKNLKILGGLMGKNDILTVEQANSLAQIPSKEELLAKVVGSMSAPISNFSYILQANIKGLISVLSKIKA